MTRRLLPLGVFALAVVGAHTAADRLDDHLFALLHTLDRILDYGLAFAIRSLGGLFSLGAGRTEALIEGALELIDLDTKLRWSVHLAIGLELLTDLLLVFALLGPGTREADHDERRSAGRALLGDPTVLRLASPLAVTVLTLVGLFVMAREVHVGALGLFSSAGLGGVGARTLTIAVAVSSVIVAGLYLVPRAWSRPLVRAHRVVAQDRVRGLSGARLRFRGAATLFVLVPVALVAGRELSRIVWRLAGGLGS